MHFSIPDTQEFIDDGGNTYMGYNIHINGLFHCTVRYKQLLNLHMQLGKELDMTLPEFPPKKLFPLTVNQQEERRGLLEKYIQTIGQNSIMNTSDLLNGFLLHAQQETAGPENCADDTLDVFLINGHKISVPATCTENSEQVLTKVCHHLELQDKFVCYFALYLMHQEEDGNVNVLRKLQNFESPLITRKNIPVLSIKIVLGKSYWDPVHDEELIHDDAALNLLFIQAASDVDRGWISGSEESRDRMTAFRLSGNKKEYLKIARSLKYYGYMQFVPCISDYPQPGTRVMVAIGKNELNLRIYQEGEETEREASFKVTRMRCWRITTLHSAVEKRGDEDYSLELSFEYLMARNQLQWITISSEQAILMSVCLQAMIDELLIKSIGRDKNQEEKPVSKTWTYLRRDGNSQVIATLNSIDSMSRNEKERNNRQPVPAKAEPIMRKLTERFSAVTVHKSNVVNRGRGVMNDGDNSTENKAFHVIGDDDL